MDQALVAARFLHLAATMVWFGSSFFAAALAPAALAQEMAALMRRIGPPLALVSLIGALAWLAFVARAMAGGELDLGVIGDVLSDTAFGAVWQARLALLALALLATLRPDRRWRAPAVLTGLAVASLGLVGHAAMQTGPEGVAHRLDSALHMLAASVWLGGLIPFLTCLRLFARAPARRDAMAAMWTYSRVGHAVVAAVFVTGAVALAMTAGALPWPPVTAWRLGLLCKVGVFAAMAAIALVNRYVFAPRVARSPRAAAALAAGAVAEIVLGLAAVALVSGFATQDPNPPR